MKIPARQFFVFAALPMVAGLIASVCVARLCYRRLGGVNLDEMAQSDSPRTTAKAAG
jgi:cobalamin synthase